MGNFHLSCKPKDVVMKKFKILYSVCEIFIGIACPKNVTNILIEGHTECECSFTDFGSKIKNTGFMIPYDQGSKTREKENTFGLVFLILASLILFGMASCLILGLIRCRNTRRERKALAEKLQEHRDRERVRQYNLKPPSPLFITRHRFEEMDYSRGLPSVGECQACIHEPPSPFFQLKNMVNSENVEDMYMSMRSRCESAPGKFEKLDSINTSI